MDLKHVLSVVSDAKYKNESILKVFRIAFDEHDEIALFRKRAVLVEYLYAMFEEIQKDEKYDTDEIDKAVIDEVCQGFCYLRLSDKMEMIGKYFTKPHVMSMLYLQKLYRGSEHYNNIEIVKVLANNLRDALHEEDVTEESKKVLLEIVEVLEESTRMYGLYGDRAMQRLFDILSGIIVLHKETLLNIKSEKVKKILYQIYTKVSMMNKITDTLLSVGKKLHGVLELFT